MSLPERARNLALLLIIISFSALFSACSDDEDSDIDTIEDPYVLTLAIQSGDNYTYYTIPFEDVMSGTLSAVGQGIVQPGYYAYNKIGDMIYCSGGLGETNLLAIYQDDDGSLRQTGGTSSFDNSQLDMVKADDNTVVSIEMSSSSDVIKFNVIDAGTVTVESSKTIPVSELSDLSSPAYSGMAISGDHLFLSFYISNPDNYATEYTDMASIAVFSYPELEFQKLITDTRTGPIGGFNTMSGLIKDENGDVYALSHSNVANGYSQKTNKGGILKIKSGETDFDADYFFDMEATTDGLNTAHLKYLGNGKAFSEINQLPSSEQESWSDGPLKSAVIDLYNKTVNYIDGIPEHSGSARKLETTALQDGKYVYLCVPEESDIYIYRADTENYTATRGAKVEANFVAGFFKF